jgi:hypothetical protein
MWHHAAMLALLIALTAGQAHHLGRPKTKKRGPDFSSPRLKQKKLAN